MSTVSALVPRVQRGSVSIPSVAAELALRDAARQFCVVTQIWRHTDVSEAGVPEGMISLLANPTSGHYVTLDDGVNTAVTLTFGTDITIGATAAETMVTLITEINTVAGLDITATPAVPASNVCYLRNAVAGEDGEVDIEYSGEEIVVIGMSSRYHRIGLSGLVAAGTASPIVSEILDVVVNGSSTPVQSYEFWYADQMLVFTNTLRDYSSSDSLKITLVVEPALLGSDYPTWLVGERYAEALVGEALFQLLRTPGRPYTSMAMAREYRVDYERGICLARRDRAVLHTTRGGSFVRNSENYGGLQG